MHKKMRQSIRGVTVLEVLIAVFVLLVGMTGVIALFPVGVTFSQKSTDDITSAMTASNALAAVRVQLGLNKRVDPYVEDTNPLGDVLSWDAAGTLSRGIDGVKGSIANVSDEFGGDVNRHTHMDVTFDGGTVDSKTFLNKDSQPNNLALMLMTSGKAAWKLYRLDADTTYNSIVASTVNGVTNFPGDGIKIGDEFQLIGARDESSEWATVPARFYEDGPPYTLGEGAVDGYGYLAIVNRVKDNELAFRVTILVYKGYDDDQPPEGNRPPIACYVTILSSDLLR